jgi:D-alanyl-D-alanine endopeptidase (penicillin-binding protein 7)
MSTRREFVVLACVAVLAAVFFVAAPSSAATASVSDRDPLYDIYMARSDLRKSFRPDDWTAVPGATAARGIVDLEDWARKYGHREYPDLLWKYAPVSASAAVVAPAANQPIPRLKRGSYFNFKALSARSVLVVDAPTGDILLARNSLAKWPIASITKLVTAMVALDSGMDATAPLALTEEDEVGGARLRLESGTRITTGDAFNAMLVGSANNAAQALARSTGLSPKEFVAAMNRKAESLGLAKTRFADPTGLDVGNVSTAREVAALARAAFDGYFDIRKAASTASYDIQLSDDQFHSIKNTNRLLTDEGNGLVVLAGKTGYLNESGWNLVVKVQDRRGRPVVAVLFGGKSANSLFLEAARAVNWVWDNYEW